MPMLMAMHNYDLCPPNYDLCPAVRGVCRASAGLAEDEGAGGLHISFAGPQLLLCCCLGPVQGLRFCGLFHVTMLKSAAGPGGTGVLSPV